ncbi:V8-like Glu-specific endopeptidase [Sphaerisporangium siamense]|uniref:V8-like Glu-specific endopeptidase n=1 Tax=Sphaerisporangium siamense TaxID=795645 RepID=A0A7W7D1G5_9ACTN|nr:trypsin-like peptidase domain-containing protein [Sphaerisporangium siamense]MBB4698579.1 V8-like Glu-specific endopeptidase [Sphaerisporangium siamense]
MREKGLEHAQAAAERYRRSSAVRDEVHRRQEQGDAFPDSPESLAARAARLIQQQGVPVEAVMEATRAASLDRPSMHERILGVAKDLQAWSFLPRGVRAARTVGRISVSENGRELPIGTGFLVSPRLLLTNHHVFPRIGAVRQAFVEFDAQVSVDNTPELAKRFTLDPDTLFVADQDLDYALVLVNADASGRPVGETFGWNRLSVQLGKLVLGEPVNIVGHPSGRLKEISIRENSLEVRLDRFLQYQTDTEPGSSGSPVYNDQWEVTALHHGGVPRTDDQGRILRRDGRLWQPGDGDDAVDWISNEGVRISAILKHLASLPLDDARRGLLAEMGPESGFCDGVAPQPAIKEQPAPAATRPLHSPVGETAPRPGRSPAVAARTGLTAATTAFGGDLHLIFLHGRDQQGRAPERLRRYWTAGLNCGLTRAGLSTIDPADVCFPFYGDRLAEALQPFSTVPHSLEEIVADPIMATAPISDTARMLYERLIIEAAARAGMPALRPVPEEVVTDAVHQGLSWLAAVTDLDRLAIAAIFGDVAAYLDDQHVREMVLECVLRTMPQTGRMVLVSHSLGTVVAVDLLTRLDPKADVESLVTVGSPLGMDSVYHRLLIGGPTRLDRVAHWFNAWCPTDPVTLGCPLGDDWHGELVETSVVNPVGRVHDVEEYLTHPEVAREIGVVLTGHTKSRTASATAPHS